MVMMQILLDLICQKYVMNFSIYVCEGYWFVVSLIVYLSFF